LECEPRVSVLDSEPDPEPDPDLVLDRESVSALESLSDRELEVRPDALSNDARFELSEVAELSELPESSVVSVASVGAVVGGRSDCRAWRAAAADSAWPTRSDDVTRRELIDAGTTRAGRAASAAPAAASSAGLSTSGAAEAALGS
jgi:hypothetical protein